MKINKTIFFATCISLVLILLRVKMTHQITYMFLIWNLFLAAIPYLISKGLFVSSVLKKSKISVITILGIWLLFLPNAPYIITDFIHLNHINDDLFWFDVIMISAFALNGLFFGILSLIDIYKIAQQFYSSKIVVYFIIACSFLSGFGVYLGRYLRFNTWDIISNPLHLFKSVYNSLYITKAWVITLSFGWFIYIVFFFTIRNINKIRTRDL